jgi:hypothetical protein
MKNVNLQDERRTKEEKEKLNETCKTFNNHGFTSSGSTQHMKKDEVIIWPTFFITHSSAFCSQNYLVGPTMEVEKKGKTKVMHTTCAGGKISDHFHLKQK